MRACGLGQKSEEECVKVRGFLTQFIAERTKEDPAAAATDGDVSSKEVPETPEAAAERVARAAAAAKEHAEAVKAREEAIAKSKAERALTTEQNDKYYHCRSQFKGKNYGRAIVCHAREAHWLLTNGKKINEWAKKRVHQKMFFEGLTVEEVMQQTHAKLDNKYLGSDPRTASTIRCLCGAPALFSICGVVQRESCVSCTAVRRFQHASFFFDLVFGMQLQKGLRRLGHPVVHV